MTGGLMNEGWIKVDDRIFAAAVQGEDGDQFRLSVERVPGGGWDWTVWSAKVEPRYGTAPSRDAAMVAAEAAVARGGALP
jgi:hypothetical protein